MRPATMEWLEHLAEVKGNSKAAEILCHIKGLENIISGLTKDNIEHIKSRSTNKELDVSDVGLIGL